MSRNMDEPAFPVTSCAEHEFVGLTLRDYFAAKALDGFMHWALEQPHFEDYDTAAKAAAAYAKSSYLIADAMLAERAK